MKIKAGVIGYGGMGSWHAGTIKNIPEFELVAVHDIDPEKNLKAEEKLGVNGYDNLQEFLAHPGLELVTIATPNHVHKPLAIACMEAGKNVISEKPVALNLQELDEMIAASKKAGVLFTVHQNRRRDGDFLTVKKIVEEGTIGKVFHIESKVGGWHPIPGGWRGQPQYGGGELYDWGVHMLDQMIQLTGELPQTVFARVASIDCPVDNFFTAHLEWKSGLSAEVSFSCFTAMPTARWVVMGTKGTYMGKDWSNGSFFTMSEDRLRTETQTKVIPTDWRAYYASGIYGALREGKELWVKPESVRLTMMLIEACRKSSETGMAIHL